MNTSVVTVGRIVHFRDSSDACQAAIVTEVINDCVGNDECIALAVFGKESVMFHNHVVKTDEHGERTWHWPERVDEPKIEWNFPQVVTTATIPQVTTYNVTIDGENISKALMNRRTAE